jgi:ATP-dependent Clp protease ATP-binding subunit ClpA
MLERFTDEARRVVTTEAVAEARRLGHDYVGTEHLTLALALSGSAVAAVLEESGAGHAAMDRSVRELLGLPRLDQDRDALAVLGIDVDDVRAAVESTFGPGVLDRSPVRRGRRGSAAVPRPRFTRRAKKVLEIAVREVGIHNREISTWHLLLGVLREGEGLGYRALVHAGVDVAGLQATVQQRLRPAA